MEYFVKAGNPEKQRVGCVVVGIFERRRLSDAAAALDAASEGALAKVLRRGDIDGKPGQTLMLHDVPGVSADRVLLVGCGKSSSFDASAYRKAVTAAVNAIQGIGSKAATLALPGLTIKGHDEAWAVRQAVMIAEDALYRFEELKSHKSDARKLQEIRLLVADAAASEAALAEGLAIAHGMSLAKDLGNRPGNVCNPAHLAEHAEALAKAHKKFKTTVLEEADMEKLGMGALLSVSRGSREPAKLIVMEYKGAGKKTKPIALVGKGLTFDAGGISLKPAQKMEEMKFDMGGAAAVFGTMQAIAELGLPINVVGVVPASENLPDGAANKPGDVIKSMAGITIEVINTDAEGRLILCDALTYVQQEFEPTEVIDMATLTGACVVALGSHATGLYANKQPLANALLAAGEEAGDRAWQLPLWNEYDEQLKSTVADVQNIGGPGGGSITAACFLHRFTKSSTWAHLDIAGTAWNAKKFGTGRPVPMLTHYLLKRAASAS